MSKTATVPEITVSHDLDSGEFTLCASSYGQVMPAGERLFRGYPHPEIRFSHTTEDSANRDAATLRAYLADCAAGKRKDKEPPRKGWWE